MDFMSTDGILFRVKEWEGLCFETLQRKLCDLDRSGVKAIRLPSPFRSVRISTGVVAVIDPSNIHPGAGSMDDFRSLHAAASRRGIRIYMDLPPLRMAPRLENPWWYDVLENGRASLYASYLEIPGFEDKWCDATIRFPLPILEETYHQSLDGGEFRLTLERSGFVLRYREHLLPLDPSTYDSVIGPGFERNRENPPELSERAILGVREVVDLVRTLPGRETTDPSRMRDRFRCSLLIKEILWRMYREEADFARFMDVRLRSLNDPEMEAECEEKGRPGSRGILHDIIARQIYQPASAKSFRRDAGWGPVPGDLEYIRVRPERGEAVRTFYWLPMEMLREGVLDGCIVPLVETLPDPVAFLKELQGFSGGGEILWEMTLFQRHAAGAEGLLADSTDLHENFSTAVELLFCKRNNLKSFIDFRNGLILEGAPFADLVSATVREIALETLRMDLQRIVRYLHLYASRRREFCDLSGRDLREAILGWGSYAVLIFSRYDSHLSHRGESQLNGEALRRAKEGFTDTDAGAFLLIESILQDGEEFLRALFRDFLIQWRSIWWERCGPVSPGGAMLWEEPEGERTDPVVDDPAMETGSGHDDFHTMMEEPRSAGSLLVFPGPGSYKTEEEILRSLSLLEKFHDWRSCVERWREWNSILTMRPGESGQIDSFTEYWIYSTLIEMWPVSGESNWSMQSLDPIAAESRLPGSFRKALMDRVRSVFVERVLREDSVQPRAGAAKRLESYLEALLDYDTNRQFIDDISSVARRVALSAERKRTALNVIRLFLPGIPQFDEVQPGLESSGPEAASLSFRLSAVASPLFSLQKETLQIRARYRDLVARGTYRRMEVTGEERGESLCFLREDNEQRLLVAVSWKDFDGKGYMAETNSPDPHNHVNYRGEISVPPSMDRSIWRNELTGKDFAVNGNSISLQELFDRMPVAILASPISPSVGTRRQCDGTTV